MVDRAAELRIKIAAAQRLQERICQQVIARGITDVGAWPSELAKSFDKSLREQKADQAELETFPGNDDDKEQRLERQIVGANRELDWAAAIFENFAGRDRHVPADVTKRRDQALSSLRSAETELERLRTIRFQQSQHPIEALDLKNSRPDALRLAAMKLLERAQPHLSAGQMDHVDGLLRGAQMADPLKVAQRIIATGTEAYARAFADGITYLKPVWDRSGAAAVGRYREIRAVEESGTGYMGVPWYVDGTIVPVAGEQQAPLINLATKITMTTTSEYWNGLATATQPVYGYVAEGTAMTDNSLTFSGPQIQIVAAKALLPGSYEIFEDLQGGFPERVQALLAWSMKDLLGNMTINGTGTPPEPLGALTQLVNATSGDGNAHVVCTTLGQFGAVDARKAWSALPGRFRDNATWVLSPTTLGVVRGWSLDNKGSGGGLSLSDYAETSAGPTLMGRPIVTSESFPAFTGSTSGSANIAMVGDFSQFYFVQRLGQALELVPNLRSTATGWPTMERALISMVRHGYQLISNSVAVLIANS